jgi:GGDEF domain-containing protein
MANEREVAKRLELSAEGAFIARFGADEFALIVSDDERMTSSEIVAGRILAMMGTEIAVAGQRLSIGATIGVAHASRDMLFKQVVHSGRVRSRPLRWLLWRSDEAWLYVPALAEAAEISNIADRRFADGCPSNHLDLEQ